MKPEDFAEEIMWLEKHQADIHATRVRVRQALAGGCREFMDKRGNVAVVTPTIGAGSMRITGFDNEGPYWHTEVSGGDCETLGGIRLIADRLLEYWFSSPSAGAMKRLGF